MTQFPGKTSLEERLALFRAQAEDFQLQADTALKYAEQVWWTWNLKRKRLKIRSVDECMLGYGEEDMNHQDSFWWERIHPKDLRAVQRSLQRCFEGADATWNCEHRLLDAANEWVWVQQSGFVYRRDSGGQPLEMVGTTRKRQEVYQLLDLFEGADAVIGAFAESSPIRFCLRDPEGVVLMQSRALEKEFEQNLGEPLEQVLSGSEAEMEAWQTAFHSTLRGTGQEVDLNLRIGPGLTRPFALHLIPVSVHSQSFCVLELFIPRGN
ncbi:MAG: PAS domain-containing protein [Oceanipulchritudo sp.]